MSLRKIPRVYGPADWNASSADLPSWGMMLAGVCLELTTLGLRTNVTACGSLLPTPTGAGNEGSPSMQKWPAHRALKAMMLPTPTASSYGSNQGGAAGRVGKVRHNLQKTAALAGILPTHTTRDWRSGAASEVAHRSGVTGGPFIALREWMMGWPLGWSASEPLATDRFQQWLHSHGKR